MYNSILESCRMRILLHISYPQRFAEDYWITLKTFLKHKKPILIPAQLRQLTPTTSDISNNSNTSNTSNCCRHELEHRQTKAAEAGLQNIVFLAYCSADSKACKTYVNMAGDGKQTEEEIICLSIRYSTVSFFCVLSSHLDDFVLIWHWMAIMLLARSFRLEEMGVEYVRNKLSFEICQKNWA